jgi:hypothetical protein
VPQPGLLARIINFFQNCMSEVSSTQRRNSNTVVPVLKCPSSIDALAPNKIHYDDDQVNLIKQLQAREPWLHVDKANAEPNPFADLEDDHQHNPEFFDDDYWLKHYQDFCTEDCLAR